MLQDPGQKSVRVVRTTTPPVIDGDLSDAVWAAAAVVDDLHQVTPVEYAVPDERTEVLISLRRQRALYRGAPVRHGSRVDHGAQHAAERQRRPGRPVLRHDRSLQRSAQRLFLRAEPERCACGRPLSQRLRVLWRLGHDFRRGLRPLRGRLDRGDRDSVQVDLVRSDDGYLGPQFLAHRGAQERNHGVGVAQPRLQSRSVGARRRLRRARAGHRSRGRAVAVRQRPKEFLDGGVGAPTRSRRSTWRIGSRRS